MLSSSPQTIDESVASSPTLVLTRCHGDEHADDLDSQDEFDEIYENLQQRSREDFEDDDDDDDVSDLSTTADGCPTPTMSKVERIVEEIWQTEKAYVSRLRLIAEVRLPSFNNSYSTKSADGILARLIRKADQRVNSLKTSATVKCQHLRLGTDLGCSQKNFVVCQIKSNQSNGWWVCQLCVVLLTFDVKARGQHFQKSYRII